MVKKKILWQLGGDSCHSRVIQNQQNLYPNIAVLRSNSGMGFLHTNDSQVIEIGEFQFRFGVLLKTVRVDYLQAENKISKKNVK